MDHGERCAAWVNCLLSLIDKEMACASSKLSSHYLQLTDTGAHGDLMGSAVCVVVEGHKQEIDPVLTPPLNMAEKLVLDLPLHHKAVTPNTAVVSFLNFPSSI